MSAARGIVDLRTSIAVDAGWLYEAVEERAHLIHVPAGLEVAPKEDGSDDPDLSIELVRGQSPFRPPAPYAVLDLRVAAPGPAGDVLAAARAAQPGSFVTPAVFEGGHLRLQLLAGHSGLDPALIEELEQPVWVASNGLDSARLVRRLTTDAALILRDALGDGALTISAVAEMSLRGLAERVPVTLTFDPHVLLDALRAEADEQSRITVDAIVALWTREDALPLLQATGVADVERARLARILTDWTVAKFATPAPAAGGQIAATVRVESPASMDATMTWDLSRGRTTTRIVVLRLEPFDAARRLVAAGGLDRVWHETIVPPIDTGVVHIDVDTNLPYPMRGIARAGVQLRAAAHPPERVQDLSAALLFDERQESQRIVWRMSPKEPVQYDYSCFALVQQGTTTKRVDAPAKRCGDRRLLIGVNDLPVDLVSVGATSALLGTAAVRGACLRESSAGDAADRVEFELSAQQPRVAVAVAPGTAPEFSVEVEACPLDGGPCVPLGRLPARGLKLDVASFPQFGPQVVDITVDFDVDVPLVALELLAERDGDDPSQAAILPFTPAAPAGQWHYMNPTPFRSGYRYRPHGAGDDAWSDVHPAGSALSVRASEAAAHAAELSERLAEPEAFVFEDLYCYPGEEAGTYLVVPLTPHPERDGMGRPLLTTIAFGDGGLLQLGIQLGPDGDAVERLRLELARRLGVEQSVPRLQVAPIEVSGVSLLIAGADGALHEIASRGTSNFPPFTALFSEQLDAAQLEAVTAATAGRPARLVARFDGRVQQRVTASLAVRGDIAAIVARTAAAGDDRDHVARAAIDDAILSGALRLETGDPAAAPPSLQAGVRAKAMDELLALVLRLSGTSDADDISAAPSELLITYSEPSWQAMSPTVDIASWFAPQSSLQPPAT